MEKPWMHVSQKGFHDCFSSCSFLQCINHRIFKTTRAPRQKNAAAHRPLAIDVWSRTSIMSESCISHTARTILGTRTGRHWSHDLLKLQSLLAQSPAKTTEPAWRRRTCPTFMAQMQWSVLHLGPLICRKPIFLFSLVVYDNFETLAVLLSSSDQQFTFG